MNLKEILKLSEIGAAKVGDILYLNNIKLKVIDTRPMPFDPPRVVNVDNGNEIKLTNNDMNKLTSKPPKINGFDIEKQFRALVDDIIYEYPNQSPNFAKFVESNKKTDSVVISFTEEVKDGRSPKFNVNGVLKLKGKKFKLSPITITIADIKFLTTSVDTSAYSEYHRHQYELKLIKE